VIRAKDVAVTIGGVDVLPPISFDVRDGERIAVVGPNGCGKSTLLRVLAGLVPATGGTLVGAPPPGRTVLVHQRPHLFRGTALANVRLAARAAGRTSPPPSEILAALGIDHVADRDVGALSGGERRRVAIARALARGPEVLLLDEPGAELDERARAAVDRVLAAFPGTIVVATPDSPPRFVARVVEMRREASGSEGRGHGSPAASQAAAFDPPRTPPR
jgi:ABC-type nitrate/sulfonate/bicarbonate transport system ATPase subunit